MFGKPSPIISVTSRKIFYHAVAFKNKKMIDDAVKEETVVADYNKAAVEVAQVVLGVIDAITEIAEDIVVNGDVRYSPMQFLTHFLFSPADQQKYISTLQKQKDDRRCCQGRNGRG